MNVGDSMNESKVIRRALTKKLFDMVDRQIHENDISPLDIAVALLTVARQISTDHQGQKHTAALFREIAAMHDEKPSRQLN